MREHQGRTDGDDKRGTTLFVANAPMVPGVSTKILLKSIFGRFAEVTRVTAVQNPRAAAAALEEGGTSSRTTSNSLLWTDKHALFEPTFLPPIFSEGKYAHVVFGSTKELKNAKKGLEEIMSGTAYRKRKGRNNSQSVENALVLDQLEVQTLSDESLRQRQEQLKALTTTDSDSDDSDNDDARDQNENNNTAKHAQILQVARRYRETSQVSRSKLLEECNAVMQAYEDAEEAKRRAKEEAMAQPDEDGFVTVSYSNAVGSKVDFEESATATTPSRRKGNKRTRKKKEAVGSGQLQDFYRFQRADNRKRTMEELRKKFEEDVRRVKRLKEEKEYRPF